MTIKYGLIGSGMMGQEHIRNLALIDGAVVTAICDPDDAMRHQAARLCDNVFDQQTAVFTDHRSLINAGDIDALLIASPNHTHNNVLDDCLSTNLPIICEKPLVIDPDEAFAMANRAEKRDAPFWVAMEYRYIPPVSRLIEEVDAGAIGKLHRLSIVEHRFPFLNKVGNWNRFSARSGGTMVEKCCHFFDLMRLITRAEPLRLYGSGGSDVNHHNERFGGETPDIIDNAYVVVDFDNGTRCALDLCMFAEGSYFQETICATGDVAKIEAKVPGPSRFWPGGEERDSFVEVSPRQEKRPTLHKVDVDERVLRAGDHHGSTFFQHQRFFNLLKEGGKVEVTAYDGAMAVAMGAAAEQSIKTGDVIRFDR